jgi:hypothetical protein
MILNIQYKTVSWDTVTIPMREKGNQKTLKLLMEDEYTQSTKILDAEYKPAVLQEVIDTCINFNQKGKFELLQVLQKYEHLFDGTLGEFNMKPLSLQLMNKECKPVHARPYTVPRSVEQQLRKEIPRLGDIGVLEEDYTSEWASPTFAIAGKNGTKRVVSDFRKLNALLPLPQHWI